ncbi:MAG: hypothetical protein HXY51_02945 [Nitrospirae bacterium]|nr:hypothetical protein [Nitrospirota bacterium]
MKHVMRRTKGIRWDLWHRAVVTRSLELMVMNRVLRHAEVDPLRHCDDPVGIKADSEESAPRSMPAVITDELGWLSRFVRRRVGSPFTHARHTT